MVRHKEQSALLLSPHCLLTCYSNNYFQKNVAFFRVHAKSFHIVCNQYQSFVASKVAKNLAAGLWYFVETTRLVECQRVPTYISAIDLAPFEICQPIYKLQMNENIFVNRNVTSKFVVFVIIRCTRIWRARKHCGVKSVLGRQPSCGYITFFWQKNVSTLSVLVLKKY